MLDQCAEDVQDDSCEKELITDAGHAEFLTYHTTDLVDAFQGDEIDRLFAAYGGEHFFFIFRQGQLGDRIKSNEITLHFVVRLSESERSNGGMDSWHDGQKGKSCRTQKEKNADVERPFMGIGLNFFAQKPQNHKVNRQKNIGFLIHAVSLGDDGGKGDMQKIIQLIDGLRDFGNFI